MENLTQTPYLQRVLHEGFRLYPAFPMYFRTAVAADQFGPYGIPAGGRVVVSPYATQASAVASVSRCRWQAHG
ncbi:MAG: hypothetical protein DLM59_11315 [Pseudonocardiales bacterium]|nr:MAG: hypothetical protein DLM59_11315 [Pseudonocardiales bacterium]